MTSWNEWDPLEEVILGTALNARIPPIDISMESINYAAADKLPPSGPYPRWLTREAEEDLDRLQVVLEQLGVKVHKIGPQNTTNGYHNFCPRDSVLVHGYHIIEAPMPVRARQNEALAMRNIFEDKMDNHYKWLSAPKPQWLDSSFQDMNPRDPTVLTLTEEEICFDAANVLRCGYDLFYLVSNSGNKKGAQWLQNILDPSFTVHTIEGMYSYMHLDSTISLLRPGLMLCNPKRVKEELLPRPLQSWDIIWCPEPYDIGFTEPYNHASPWLNMNLLMVNPELAIVESHQETLIDELAKHGIESMPLPFRHGRTFGGCFHCVTLDIGRRGSLEMYL